jgi:transposase
VSGEKVDNATFHHGGRIAQLIEAAECQLIYLPPYSPDLNRIEKYWATLKSRIRKLLLKSDNLRDAIAFTKQLRYTQILVSKVSSFENVPHQIGKRYMEIVLKQAAS